MAKGSWTTTYNNDGITLTHSYSTTTQTQLTITDNTITMYTKAKHYEAIKAIVNNTNARGRTPSKSRRTSSGSGQGAGDVDQNYSIARRTTPDKSQQGGGEEQDRHYRENQIDYGVLKGQNEGWRFQAKAFIHLIDSSFGIQAVVTNMATVSATLWEGRMAGKKRKVTINYYLSSGIFTLTGPKTKRDPFHNFFHQTVNDGPPQHNTQQMEVQEETMETGQETPSEQTLIEEDPYEKENIVGMAESDTETMGGQELEETDNTQEDLQEPELDLEGTPPPPLAHDLEIECARLPSIAAYMASQQADTIEKKMGKGDKDELAFKKKHMRCIVRLIMQEMIISGGEIPQSRIPPSIQKYGDNLAKTAATKLVKWLLTSSEKWTVQASLAIQNLGKIHRADTEEEIIISALHTKNENQTNQIAGLNAQMRDLQQQVKTVREEMGANRHIKKFNPPTPSPVWDWHEVVKHLMKEKNFKPSSTARLPLLTHADHKTAYSRMGERVKAANDAIDVCNTVADKMRKDLAITKSRLTGMGGGAQGKETMNVNAETIKHIIRAIRPHVACLVSEETERSTNAHMGGHEPKEWGRWSDTEEEDAPPPLKTTAKAKPSMRKLGMGLGIPAKTTGMI